MAKVKNPFLSVDARGSVNGMTASRSRSGQIMKAKSSPVQPRTQSQQSRRYTFARLNRQFQSLTDEQIQAWNDFASNWTVTDKFGDAIKITGLNWFEALNSRLDAIKVSLQSTPPLNPNSTFNAYVSIFQDTASTGNIYYRFTGTVSLPGNWAVWLGYSSNLPLTSQFKKKSLKLREIITTPSFSNVTLISHSDLSYGDSLRQFEWFGVDDNGRATPRQRVTIYPVNPA